MEIWNPIIGGHSKSMFAQIWRFLTPSLRVRFRTFQKEPFPLRFMYIFHPSVRDLGKRLKHGGGYGLEISVKYRFLRSRKDCPMVN